MAKTTSFEEHATEYDAWFEQNPDTYKAELETVRSVMPERGRGVEIGVGTGRFAAALGISVGVEPSRRMAELARQRGVEVLEGVAEDLPFANSSFDFVLMTTVVCFLDDVAWAFREAGPILKSQGALIVGIIDRESYLGRQYSMRKQQSRFYHDATFHSVAELEELMTGAGFTDFIYRQALFQDESSHRENKDGYGSGGFVVVHATKIQEDQCL